MTILSWVMSLGGEEGQKQETAPNPNNPNPTPTLPLSDSPSSLLLASHHASHLTDLSPSFFTPIVLHLTEHHSELATQPPLDEELAIRHHRQYFPQPTSSPSPPEAATARGLGDAAALQALRMFRVHSVYDAQQGGGVDCRGRDAFVGLAMAQAVRLWEAQRAEGNVGGGVEVEGAVMKAGEVAVWLWARRGEVGGGAPVGWDGETLRGEEMV
ncbi:hypothetical protein QBC39DRAFT_145917 [Podospora conica]|nr:hypothetical protein QBC39DRAFT_145917 [Schizothecium conicum]